MLLPDVTMGLLLHLQGPGLASGCHWGSAQIPNPSYNPHHRLKACAPAAFHMQHTQLSVAQTGNCQQPCDLANTGQDPEL